MVRFVGDVGPYVKVVNTAIGSTNMFGDTVTKVSAMVNAAFESMNLAIEKAKQMIESFAMATLGVISRLGGAITVLGGVGTAFTGSIIGMGLAQAAALERTNVAFATLLGSAKEAEKLVNRLMLFADITPFSDEAILAAARGLVTFGERGDELMKTLEDLGNAAAATNSDFGMITLIFNQIRGVGKLLTQDFRQLSTRGVLTLQDIAEHFGVAETAAAEMISRGRVGFKDVAAIMSKLSAEGGRFANMMQKQSETLAGLMETFKGYVLVFFRDIGKVAAPIAKFILDIGIRLLKAWDQLPGVLKNFVGLLVLATAAASAFITIMGGILVLVAPLGMLALMLFKVYSAIKLVNTITILTSAGVGVLINTFQWISEKAKAFADVVQDAVLNAVIWLTERSLALSETIRRLGDDVVLQIGRVVVWLNRIVVSVAVFTITVSDYFNTNAQKIQEFVSGIISASGKLLEALAAGVEYIAEFAKSVADAISGVVRWIGDALISAAEAISEFFTWLSEQLAVAQAHINRFQERVQRLVDNIDSKLKSSLGVGQKALTGFMTTAQATGVVMWAMLNPIAAIAAAIGKLPALYRAATAAIKEFTAAKQADQAAGGGFFSGLFSGFKKLFPMIKTAIKLVGQLVKAFLLFFAIKIAKGLIDYFGGNDLAKTRDNLTKQNEKITGSIRDRGQRKANEIREEKNYAAAVDKARENMKQLGEEERMAQAEMARLKKEQEAATGTWQEWIATPGKFLMGLVGQEVDTAAELYEDLIAQQEEVVKARRDAYNEQVKALEEAFAQIKAESIGEVDKKIQGLEYEMRHLGKTAEQAFIDEMKYHTAMKLPLEERQELLKKVGILERIQAEANWKKKQLEEAEKYKETLVGSVEEMENLAKSTWEEALALQGVTAEQLKMQEMEQNLAKLKELHQITGDAELVEKIRQAEWFIKSIKANQAFIKAEEERKKTMEEGKRAIEQYLTPQEKYRKQLEDIQRLFDAGAIDAGTANRWFDSAKEEFADAIRDADKLKSSVEEAYAAFENNEAVLSGTRESREAVLKFLQNLEEVEAKKKEDIRIEQEIARNTPKGFGAGGNGPGPGAGAGANAPVPRPKGPSGLPETEVQFASADRDLFERIANAVEKQAEKETVDLIPTGLA